MSGLKQLTYAGVMVSVAFAVNPTEKYGCGSDLALEEQNRVGADTTGLDASSYSSNSLSERRYRVATPHRGSRLQRPKPANPMPPTSCRSVESVPIDSDMFSKAHSAHYLTFSWFVYAPGFGLERMILDENSRGVAVASRAIDRVELVSLLTGDKPSVYVLDEQPTLGVARQAKRRPLDEFERLGLDALRRGEYLVWTPEAPTRMFGAILAHETCLECHSTAKKGELLGAFTYYLNKPVDQLYNK